MKNIIFNEQINLFLKNKAIEHPRYAHIRISLHTQLSACVSKLDLAHA